MSSPTALLALCLSLLVLPATTDGPRQPSGTEPGIPAASARGPAAPARLDVPRPRPAPTPDSARKTVAVLNFDNNSGDTIYNPLGKGIADMMISDLSSVPEIQLVERQHLADLTHEMEMQHSHFFDQSTAAQAGKLVGAQYVVAGAIMALDPKVRLDTRVIQVQTGEIVKTAEVTGDQKNLFDLQQRLAKELIDGLGVALTPEDSARLRKQQEADRLATLDDELRLSEALDLYDRKMYVEAAEKALPLARDNPDNVLVQATYKVMEDRAKDEAKHKLTKKLKGLFHH